MTEISKQREKSPIVEKEQKLIVTIWILEIVCDEMPNNEKATETQNQRKFKNLRADLFLGT